MRHRLHQLLAGLGPGPFYAWRTLEEAIVFARRLRVSPGKTVADSKSIYERYDDREQRDYESRSRLAYYRGQLREMSFRDIRARYLEYLCEELKPPLRILEVGCGNCINLMELRRRYSSAVELHGLDVSAQRITVARKHYGDALDGVEFTVGSITERTPWPDRHFDVVYSMFCLEQIAYETRSAVAEMMRLARSKVVMIEPVYELAGIAQRLYLYNADHTRILLKSIRDLGVVPARLESLDISDNPVNQSSIVVLDSAAAAAAPRPAV